MLTLSIKTLFLFYYINHIYILLVFIIVFFMSVYCFNTLFTKQTHRDEYLNQLKP